MRLRKLIVGALAFATIIVAWELAAYLNLYNKMLLPPPSDSVYALIDAWRTGILANDLQSSLSRYVPGFVIGSIVGIGLGIVTGVSRSSGNALNPLLYYLRSIPPVALIPFALVLFGIDDAGKISLVAWACMFPVWLNTQMGVKMIPDQYLDAASIYGSVGLHKVINIWLPYTLPHIVGGLRMAVATGIFALTASEMFAASSGIGFRIVYSHQLFQTDLMVAMIVLLGLVAVAADVFVVSVRRAVAPWESLDD